MSPQPRIYQTKRDFVRVSKGLKAIRSHMMSYLLVEEAFPPKAWKHSDTYEPRPSAAQQLLHTERRQAELRCAEFEPKLEVVVGGLDVRFKSSEWIAPGFSIGFLHGNARQVMDFGFATMACPTKCAKVGELKLEMTGVQCHASLRKLWNCPMGLPECCG